MDTLFWYDRSPNPDSELVRLTKEVMSGVLGREPKARPSKIFFSLSFIYFLVKFHFLLFLM